MLSRKEIRDLIPGPYENTKRETDRRTPEGSERNRKGHFQIRVTDRNGRSVPGVKIQVKQTALFGCFIV